MLKNKKIILGVSGSIAAYKIASLASMLKKQGAEITVIMTQNATQFIHPITFETLTGSKCLTDTFDRNFEYNVEHISLAKWADVFLLAPASANVIGKIANGIADDMLTTTFLACGCHKIVAPAMNTRMYHNRIVQDNLEKCRRYGMEVLTPAAGYLACGDTGEGKMPEPETLYSAIEHAISHEKDMTQCRVLVTAGPTVESIDPVRFISNHSTGKMGYAIARACMLRGADVTLVSGPVSLTPPPYLTVLPVRSAKDMFEAVTGISASQDIIIKAAAVADYRPASIASEKIKKSDASLSMPLERTDDILGYLGAHKQSGQFLCGFSMETEHMVENSRAKLKKKNLDMIVANNLKTQGAGFGTDTNIVTILTADSIVEFPVMSKDEVAEKLLDRIVCERRNKTARSSTL